MNYNDIKNIIVSSTHNLKALPPKVLRQILTHNHWHFPSIVTPLSLKNATLPRVTYITHSTGTTRYPKHLIWHGVPPTYRNYFEVGSILVDEVPAFFFVHASRGYAMEEVTVFSLDKYLTWTFILLLVELYTEQVKGQVQWVQHVVGDTHLKALTNFNDVDIKYKNLAK